MTTKSDDYRENARDCAELATDAKDEQDWLDGALSPDEPGGS
ncbi:MAG: hypothetical protein WBA62_22100 [Xanthobacteraceae bacterium]